MIEDGPRGGPMLPADISIVVDCIMSIVAHHAHLTPALVIRELKRE